MSRTTTIVIIVFGLLFCVVAAFGKAESDKEYSELIKTVKKLEKENKAIKKTVEAKTLALAKWMDEYHENSHGNLYHYYKIRATK